MAEKKNSQFSIRVPDWVHTALKERAAAQRRSLGSYVGLVLEEHIRSNKKVFDLDEVFNEVEPPPKPARKQKVKQ